MNFRNSSKNYLNKIFKKKICYLTLNITNCPPQVPEELVHIISTFYNGFFFQGRIKR